jgi:hypothetical protein
VSIGVLNAGRLARACSMRDVRASLRYLLKNEPNRSASIMRAPDRGDGGNARSAALPSTQDFAAQRGPFNGLVTPRPCKTCPLASGDCSST